MHFNNVVGSNKLKFEHFTSSTEVRTHVDFEDDALALLSKDRQPPQPLSDVRIKPHVSGQDNLILTFEDVEYVPLLDDGKDTDRTLILGPVLDTFRRPWFRAFDRARQYLLDTGAEDGEEDAPQILQQELNLKFNHCKSLALVYYDQII